MTLDTDQRNVWSAGWYSVSLLEVECNLTVRWHISDYAVCDTGAFCFKLKKKFRAGVICCEDSPPEPSTQYFLFLMFSGVFGNTIFVISSSCIFLNLHCRVWFVIHVFSDSVPDGRSSSLENLNMCFWSRISQKFKLYWKQLLIKGYQNVQIHCILLASKWVWDRQLMPSTHNTALCSWCEKN
jgi:hypothetical protein